MKVTHSPRKAPRQCRSQITVAAILEAATRVFVEVGFTGATTNQIAERAGVSVGSLYQYFPNKLALLAALQERQAVHLLSSMRGICARGTEHSLAVSLRRMVETSANHFAAHGALERVFQAELPWRAQGRRVEVERDALHASMMVLLGQHRASIRVEDLQLATFFICAMGRSVMTSAVRERAEDLRCGLITGELTSAILLYLTGDPHGLSRSRHYPAAASPRAPA